MSADLNKIIVTGRLTRDPELKQSTSGISLIQESIAVRGNKNTDGKYHTNFFEFTAFKGTAETISQYCHKGDAITLCGSLEQTKYKNKDGNEVRAVKILVGEFWFGQKKEQEPQMAELDPNEELPF